MTSSAVRTADVDVAQKALEQQSFWSFRRRYPYPVWRRAVHEVIDQLRFRLDRARRADGPAAATCTVVHTEAIADAAVFASFERFCRFFRSVTGTPLVVCITPGVNPIIREHLHAEGVTQAEYIRRARALAASAHLGYHGHFVHEARVAGYGVAIRPMTHSDFDDEKFRGQLEKDLGWFDEVGVRPTCYTGGWWVLNRSMAASLEAAGIAYDFTLRPSRRNTFGETYDFAFAKGPNGGAVRLGPRLWEIGSYAALWRYPAALTAAPAYRPDERATRFVALYFHDYDVLTTGRGLRRTVRALSRLPRIRWASFDESASLNLE